MDDRSLVFSRQRKSLPEVRDDSQYMCPYIASP
jgi:hypothetical protein